MSANQSLHDLWANRVPPELRDPQVAVTGMLPPGVGAALAELSRLRKTLPQDVPGYGRLPPGDVVNIAHFTGKQGLTELDPSTWGSRLPGIRGAQNKESAWVEGNPDIYNTQAYLPDYGFTKEPMLGNTKIEGAVPGMYNMTEDPAGIAKFVADRYDAAHQGSMYGNDPIRRGNDLKELVAREVANRGYTGSYRPEGANQGGTAMFHDLVDLTGNAPNIQTMRAQLGLDVAPGSPETPSAPGSVAQVTMESMPGASVTPETYRGFENNPAAGHLLHRDYERLLRNPDGGSVVAQRLGIEAPTFQGQGYFQGQSNPLTAQRIAVEVPKVDRTAPIEVINQQRALGADSRDKLTALAVVEAKLRQQDATAWSYPVAMTSAADMPTKGLPPEAITAVMLRGKSLTPKDLKTITKDLESIEVPDEYRWSPKDPKKTDAQNRETLAQHFVTVPAPDGGPGVFVFNPHDAIPAEYFRETMAKIRDAHARAWTRDGSTDFDTQWGTHDSRYIEAADYDGAIDGLPDELKGKAQSTIEELDPFVEKIRGYHHDIRGRR